MISFSDLEKRNPDRLAAVDTGWSASSPMQTLGNEDTQDYLCLVMPLRLLS